MFTPKPPRRVAVWALATCGLAAATLGLPLRDSAAHGAHEDRVARLAKAIESRPDEAELWLRKAELHLEEHEAADALAALANAAAIGPQAARANLLRGRAHLAMGDPKRALLALDRCIAAAPRGAAARRERARARGQLGRHADADADYRLAIELSLAHRSPGLPDLYLERARLLAEWPEPRLAEALGALDEAMAVLGHLPGLASTAVELELRRGAFEAALRRLDRLPGAAQRRPVWLARRADILQRAGQHSEAQESWREMIEAVAGLSAATRRSPVYVQLVAEAHERGEATEVASP